MDSKNYTQVLIDGKVYTLGGSEDESYLQKAASYVNEKNSVMRKVPGFTKQSADYQMFMTELNIADDYFKAVERADEMERQKNDMEKETYSLKHELVSTQMKLEAVLKDLEERQMELDRQSRRSAELEGELKEARKSIQAFKDKPESEPAEARLQQSVRIQAETVEETEGTTKEIAETVEAEAALTLEIDKAAAADSAESEHSAQAGTKPSAASIQASSQAGTTGTGAPAAAMSASTASGTGMSDEELARKALQAARKAGSHKGGRR